MLLCWGRAYAESRLTTAQDIENLDTLTNLEELYLGKNKITELKVQSCNSCSSQPCKLTPQTEPTQPPPPPHPLTPIKPPHLDIPRSPHLHRPPESNRPLHLTQPPHHPHLSLRPNQPPHPRHFLQRHHLPLRPRRHARVRGTLG